MIFHLYIQVTLQYNLCKFRVSWPCRSIFIRKIQVGNARIQKALVFYGGMGDSKTLANRQVRNKPDLV